MPCKGLPRRTPSPAIRWRGWRTSTPTSKGSSTPRTTSAPIDALRSILDDEFPAWGPDPLEEALAARLAVSKREARDALAGLRVWTHVPLSTWGRLDETWLFRLDAGASARERAAGTSGVASIHDLEGDHAIVRTLARDAVDRERLLRALHARLGGRPLAELHRSTPSRKPTKEERSIVLAMHRHPWGPLATIAKASGVTAKVARERIGRLVHDRLVALQAEADGLAYAVARASPSSTAAIARAFGAIDGVARVWLPASGEAAVADALVVGRPTLEAARDVPGVRSVDLYAVRGVWRDDALIDAAIRGA